MQKTLTIPIQPTTAMLRGDSTFDLAFNTMLEPTAFQKYQFVPQSSLKLATNIVAGVGAGKSRLLGRIFAWMALISKRPGVILDPTGGVVDNLFDKIVRLPPAAQANLWSRLIYITPGNKQAVFPSHLYYRLSADDTFFEIANRFPSVVKRQDQKLQDAPILGWNSLYECLIYAGQIAAAKNLQLDFVADLIERPSKYKGLLREVWATYSELRPAVEYLRSLIDPSSSSMREKKTGSAMTKLLPFLADPVRMAMYAGSSNLLNWTKLLKQRKLILIDYRYEHDPDHLQFDMIWHVKGFIDAIKQRGMAGRGEEVMLIIDEISAMLGQRTPDGRSILAEDLQELIKRIGRNYGVNTVIAYQSLSQLDERMQDIFMDMGNQIIGLLSNPADALRVAQQFMRYDPYKVKKTENVYFPMREPPILQFMSGYYGQVPVVIDEHTHEFTIQEQNALWINQIQSLDRFQFLVQLATGEGGKRGPVQKITIANLDKNLFPTEEILAPLRQALARRDGIPVKTVLAEMQKRQQEEDSAQPPTEGKQRGILKNKLPQNDVPRDDLSIHSSPATPVSAPVTQSGATTVIEDEPVLQ